MFYYEKVRNSPRGKWKHLMPLKAWAQNLCTVTSAHIVLAKASPQTKPDIKEQVRGGKYTPPIEVREGSEYSLNSYISLKLYNLSYSTLLYTKDCFYAAS